MKRRAAIALLCIAAVALAYWGLQPRGPTIPSLLANSIPDGCEQVALVLSPEATSVEAKLWLMERNRGRWRPVRGPLPVTLGHAGLAWGAGVHHSGKPDGFRLKHEGDLCSPAGVFRIPFAFGLAPAAGAAWLKLDYKALTPSIIGVDDPNSSHYNEVVDSTLVERDWDSNEPMMRHDRLYEWGAFIGHNPERVPGGGSCIFFHLWTAPGKGTAGCTAMSAEDLRTLLAWMDPKKHPLLVQGLEEW